MTIHEYLKEVLNSEKLTVSEENEIKRKRVEIEEQLKSIFGHRITVYYSGSYAKKQLFVLSMI